jgi:hypothetical protein
MLVSPLESRPVGVSRPSVHDAMRSKCLRGYRPLSLALQCSISLRLRSKARMFNDWNYWNICREMTGEKSPNGVNGMAR